MVRVAEVSCVREWIVIHRCQNYATRKGIVIYWRKNKGDRVREGASVCAPGAMVNPDRRSVRVIVAGNAHRCPITSIPDFSVLLLCQQRAL